MILIISDERDGHVAYVTKKAFASAFPGTIIGPERSPEGYWVGQLLQHRAASFDDRTQARIEDLLFQDWLEERRKQATVRWHWV